MTEVYLAKETYPEVRGFQSPKPRGFKIKLTLTILYNFTYLKLIALIAIQKRQMLQMRWRGDDLNACQTHQKARGLIIMQSQVRGLHFEETRVIGANLAIFTRLLTRPNFFEIKSLDS